jgi:hypothetical protein
MTLGEMSTPVDTAEDVWLSCVADDLQGQRLQAARISAKGNESA